ncbi:pectinesterase family protein [Paenibacillus sp. y28]|uniref:pectinesterase family protein n=1 Tax=Paenibacillus sp. y28 TaxID=3129110 RepID=UPI00301AEDEF
MKKALTIGISVALAINLLAVDLLALHSGGTVQAASIASEYNYPSQLKAIAGDKQVALSWQAPTAADSYNVKRSTTNGGPYTTVKSGLTATSYTDGSLDNGTVYYYTITAVKNGEESYISNQVKSIPHALTAGAPETPQGFAAIAEEESVKLTWNEVAGANSYEVKRSLTSDGGFTTVATVPASAAASTGFEDQSVTQGTQYYYIVNAINSNGTSQATEPLIVAPAKVIVVAQPDPETGSTPGDFTTIQAAVNSISASNTARTVIYIEPGTYREQVKITAPYVSLVGAGRDKTKLVYDLSNADFPNNALNGATLSVKADNFTAENMTFENDSLPEDGQAIAVLVNGDQAVFENVKFVGYQDTLYAGLRETAPRVGRQYYHNSTIIGKTDYIYGPASAAVFDNVEAVSLGNGGFVTAAATKLDQPGLIFLNSRLLKDSTATQGTHYLGRPWQDYPTVRFINTYMDDHIHPDGWTTMQVDPYLFAEYNSTGPGASTTTRKMSSQLTSEQANELTIPRVFEGWDPTKRVILPRTSPEISLLTSPGNGEGMNGEFTTSAVVSVEISGNDSGLNQAEYRINGGVWNAYTAEFELNVKGTYTIDYRLVDADGNQGTIFTREIVIDPDALLRTPAFPGAEGGAMYATGGRGKEVYFVTTVEDYDPSTEAPIPGSLRDAVSQGDRTIVFRVSGVIDLKTGLSFSNGNTTIAGQTAPGDGITLSGYPVAIGGKDGGNLIIRYLRFRQGIKQVGDAANVGGDNIIIDHCSFSWSSDETFSVREHRNITVQYSIISNSLNISIHGKGAHGYGAIWGGTNVTYHHNLIINHNSRNPRFDKQLKPLEYPTKIDFRNNVVYNWGGNSAYGGEAAMGINIVNNYYKPGPNTFDNVRTRLVAPSGQDLSSWYIEGNKIEGYPVQSADNWLESVNPDYGLSSIKRLTKAVVIPDSTDPIGGPVTTDSPDEAYAKVVASAGASLPRRDSLDAKIIHELVNGTGIVVNTIESDGGLPVLNSLPAPLDTDQDGIPDEWEQNNGLDMNDPTDGNQLAPSGFTYLELYMNSIVRNGADNPTVDTSLTMNQQFTLTSPITIEATAAASEPGGSITKIEFYDGSTKIGEATSAPYSFTWNGASEGRHYMYAKATDNTGSMTLSTVKVIHVNGPENVEPDWTSEDIGAVPVPGTASFDGTTYMVKGSGNIGRSSDKFHYTHQKVSGNFEFISNVAIVSEVDTDTKAGLMLRTSLQPNSPMALMGLTYIKEEGKSAQFLSRTAEGTSPSVNIIKSGDNIRAPYWFKLTRDGNTITGSVSTDGKIWGKIGSAEINLPDEVYIGFAVEANKSSSNANYLTAATFDGVQVKRSPAFSVNNPASEIVTAPLYTVTGQLIDAADLTITNNGETVVSAETFAANADFSKDIPLKAGVNTIVISAKNSATFGDMVNRKTLQVTYNKTEMLITPSEAVPTVVTTPSYSFKASVNVAATVSVSLNGAVVLDPAQQAENALFEAPLTLREGPNEIVVTATDAYNETVTATYTVTYYIDWGNGTFTLSNMQLRNLAGEALTGLLPSQDIVVNVSAQNNSAISQNGLFLIALYDGNGQMVKYYMIDQALPGGGTQPIEATIRLPKSVSGYAVKAQVYDSFASQSSLSNMVVNP